MSKLKFNSGHAQGRKLLLLLLFFLLTPLFIFAQKTVSGVVTSEDGQPLIGANVLVQGTDIGTITDIDGSYTLDNVPEDAVIVISFIGYDTQEIGVAGRNDIDVLVTATGVLLDQLVVTGYATERKKDILGAVSVADMDAVRDLSNHSVLQSLAGRVPGLYLDQSGVPGQGAKVRVRGNSTLGNNQPLYIIDGVPLQSFETIGTQTGMAERISQPPVVDLSWLNPNDIESVQVLKDASSASIYGSRASNGVVIITTKQPKEQESRVTFNARFGVENVHYRAPFVTTERGAMLGWQSAVNSGSDPNDAAFFDFDWHFDPSLGPGIQGNGVPVLDRVIYTADWLDEPNNLRPSGHPQSNLGGTLEEGTNWQDIAYEKGLIQNYDVQFSRGSKKGGVQFSMNFFDQKGVLIGNNFQRLGLRLNSNYKFANEKLTVGQNVAVSRGKRQWGVFSGLGPPPILPPFTEDGEIAGVPPGFTRHDNPLGTVDNDKWDRNNNTKVFGNVYLNWDIIEGLSFRTNMGLDYDNIFIRDIYPTFERGLARNATGELRQTQLHQTNLVFNNTLTYTKSFNQHSFTVLGGTEYIDNFVTDFQAFGKDFALNTNEYYQFDAATGEKNVNGGTSGFKLFSYFGKVNYSFADKYLASFTVRRDGSSRFGTENRFAVFPAASVGWRIGAEEFMQDVDWLSALKIRVAWGQTGNQDILNEARFRLYRAVYAPPSNFTPWGAGCAQTYCTNAATAYDISNNNTGLLPSGFIATQTDNDQLKWETQTEINVGIDFGLLNDRITGSFDVFNKDTEGILIVQNQPGTFGDGFSLFTNGADMETKGWELALDYHSKPGRDWRYSIGLIGSHYSDKITSLPEDLYGTYPGNSEQNIVGQSPRQLFGFISTGILENQAQVEAAPSYPGIRVGALGYADLNNDGIITELDQEYQEVNGLPSVEYGMNAQIGWKNFDAAVQIWGMAGRTVAIGGGFIGFGNENLNAWTTVNTDTHVPALGIGGGGVQSQAGGTSYQFRNGSFFKFSQFTLGYTLPQTVTGNMSWLSDLRVYFTLDNIWYMYDKKGANRFPSEPWLLDQINFTPGAGPDAHGRGQGNFETRHPKPLAASIGVNIGF
jgi:TonB-linked SusC/RagA family outer membrane protein